MSTKLPIEELLEPAGEGGVSFTIELAGDVFGVGLRYNDRDERYYVTLIDEDAAVIVDGVKVVLGVPLFARVTDPRRPKGDVFAVDVGAKAEPTLGTLGNGVDLIFVPWSEVLA